MAGEVAQIEGLRRENAMLKERLKEFERTQEELKRAQKDIERILEEQKASE
jgi:hypothetical protein